MYNKCRHLLAFTCMYTSNTVLIQIYQKQKFYDRVDMDEKLQILDLSNCILRQIVGYLSYNQIAECRMVSFFYLLQRICNSKLVISMSLITIQINTRFNAVCQSMLNLGFREMTRRHNTIMQAVKSGALTQAKVLSVLKCIESRISTLSLIYSDYIEKNVCCFIPGKVRILFEAILKQMVSMSYMYHNKYPFSRSLMR